MGERGVIRNREAKRQIVDMSGLRYGKITPTDLDAFLDFGNRLFVFVECKYMNAPLSYGQRLAIERLVDACHMPPQRYAVAFVVEHNGGEADIAFAGTTVRQYRWTASGWRRRLTVRHCAKASTLSGHGAWPAT